uniref:TOBE domain-containing protein n=1 Tax=Aestuariivirga sp. TaxID=2650926 RepID=UPI0035B298C9
DGLLHASTLGEKLTAPRLPPGFQSGYLVIRPEFLTFLPARPQTGNALGGKLYNEYVLGSRIQYQVRVGDSVFVVEKLRQQPFTGKLDDDVFIGWQAQDAILVAD